MSNTSENNMGNYEYDEEEIPCSQKRLEHFGHDDKELEELYAIYFEVLLPDLLDKYASNNTKSKENKTKK